MKADSPYIGEFTVPVRPKFSLTMPRDARILALRETPPNERPVMWVYVGPNSGPLEERVFFVIGNNRRVDELDKCEADTRLLYVGTFIQSGGYYVWHVLERKDV